MAIGEVARRTNGPADRQVATVQNSRSAHVGSVSFAGRVFNVSGEHIGTVGLDGRVCMPQGTLVGWASPLGQIADQRGLVLTQMLPTGSVVDRHGSSIGRVTLPLDVSVQQAAGAALLLLPVEGVA